MPAQEYELSLHVSIFHSERSVRGFIFSDKGGTLNNYPCEGSGSREMKQREEGGKGGGGGSRAFRVAGGKNFLLFSW